MKLIPINDDEVSPTTSKRAQSVVPTSMISADSILVTPQQLESTHRPKRININQIQEILNIEDEREKQSLIETFQFLDAILGESKDETKEPESDQDEINSNHSEIIPPLEVKVEGNVENASTDSEELKSDIWGQNRRYSFDDSSEHLLKSKISIFGVTRRQVYIMLTEPVGRIGQN
ncbi:hypothetical protein HK096_001870, partial [Nowakowskiella sp. JEL0078]